MNPFLTQLRATYFGADCGMGYVLRLSDGKFVIIDGNMGEEDEPERLYDLLVAQSEGRAPAIAAWFITHPHADHFGCFVKFCQSYSNRVTVERVLYHFPRPGVFGAGASDTTSFFEVLSHLNAEIITPHTGDTFDFADAHFEVIFTCEDLYPGPIVNINDSSLVLRMTLGRYKVLFLGDLQRDGSDYIMSHVDPARIACDVMQVGHHGYGGGSDALHRAANPKYLLWPCPDFWFHTVRLWACNDYLINSRDIVATFVSGQAEYTFDLTAPMEYKTPYPEDEVRAPLEEASVSALGWSCLTGGVSGYAPAKISFDGKGCILCAGDALSLCELIQRGQIAESERYTFSFSGSVKHAELFALCFDHPSPMTFSQEKLVHLPQASRFAFRLTVDRALKKAEIWSGNELLHTIDTIGDAPADIILVLKNAEIYLDEVVCRRVPFSKNESEEIGK